MPPISYPPSEATVIIEDNDVGLATEHTLSLVESSASSLDSKATAGNASLASIDSGIGDVDASIGVVNSSIGSSNSLLTSMDGKATTGNSSLSSIDSKASTTNSSLSSIYSGLTAVYTSLVSRLAGDPLRDIPLGLHAHAIHVAKYGRNTDVDSNGGVIEDIWERGGVYTGFPTGSAETVSVVSTSTQDASSGTGIRTLRLIGLDANYDAQTEDVTLNGTGTVTTTKTFTRVNRAHGLTAGSTGSNVGTITFNHSSTTANVFGTITPGMSQTQIAAYTIPNGYTGLVLDTKLSISNSASTAQELSAALVVRDYGTGVWRVQRMLTTSTATGLLSDTLVCGFTVSAKSDIVFRSLTATSDNLSVSGMFEIAMFKLADM